MNVREAIRERRSVRRYAEREVSEDHVRQLIDAAMWAPSGGNAQTWRFVVVRDQRRIRQLRVVSPGLPGPPPCVVALCQDTDAAAKKGARLGAAQLIYFDTAMAAQNILLSAHELGLGACVVASFHRDGISRCLRLPPHIAPVLLVAVGWPAEAPRAPERKRHTIAYAEEYGGQEIA